MRYCGKVCRIVNLKNRRHVYVAQKYENLQIKTLLFVCVSA